MKFADVLCRAVEEWRSQDITVKEPKADYVMINNGGVHTKVMIKDREATPEEKSMFALTSLM